MNVQDKITVGCTWDTGATTLEEFGIAVRLARRQFYLVSTISRTRYCPSGIPLDIEHSTERILRKLYCCIELLTVHFNGK